MHQFISHVYKLRRERGRGVECKVRYTKINKATENLFRQIFDFVKKTSQFSSFYWKFLKIGILRVKDIRKNVSILLEGGSNPALHTLLVIRVVLLLALYGVLNPLVPQLYD